VEAQFVEALVEAQFVEALVEAQFVEALVEALVEAQSQVLVVQFPALRQKIRVACQRIRFQKIRFQKIRFQRIRFQKIHESLVSRFSPLVTEATRFLVKLTHGLVVPLQGQPTQLLWFRSTLIILCPRKVGNKNF
jgi:hypothetical protein